jgi:hypothetical protein
MNNMEGNMIPIVSNSVFVASRTSSFAPMVKITTEGMMIDNCLILPKDSLWKVLWSIFKIFVIKKYKMRVYQTYHYNETNNFIRSIGAYRLHHHAARNIGRQRHDDTG